MTATIYSTNSVSAIHMLGSLREKRMGVLEAFELGLLRLKISVEDGALHFFYELDVE